MEALMNWSGGKDSALALYRALQKPELDVKYLLTTFNGADSKVGMHGIPEALVEKQAEAIGLPLRKIYLPEQPSMKEYNSAMEQEFKKLKGEGIIHSIYGDIFLEDLRAYREKQMEELGLKAEFPLWREDTRSLMKEFVDRGFKSIVVSLNAELLDDSFLGRTIDHGFLQDLPPNVDPCGENGEFHTFVFDGPIFSRLVDFQKGSIEERCYDSPTEKRKKMRFRFLEIF